MSETINAVLTGQDDLTLLPEAYRGRTPVLVARSRKHTEYFFKENDEMEVVRLGVFDGQIDVECFKNPDWAGGPMAPKGLEEKLFDLMSMTPQEEHLDAIQALMGNERPSAVLQSWYYIEVIYQLVTVTVRLAFPIHGKTRDVPFEHVIEKGVESVLAVRQIAPVVTEAEVAGTSNGGVWINWSARFVGHGQLYLGFEAEKPVLLGTETLGKDFAKLVMNKLIDNATIED